MIRSSNMREKLLAAAIIGTFSSQAFSGTVTTDGADIVLKTKGGLEVSTSDKEFSFKLGGRVQADYGRFDGVFTKNGDTADAGYFRRAYLELGGVLYRDWKYQLNYDLSRNTGNDSDGYFDEASLTYTGFKPVQLRFGRFYTDFGLEKATSSKWTTAMERNLSYDLADWINDNAGMGIQATSTIIKEPSTKPSSGDTKMKATVLRMPPATRALAPDLAMTAPTMPPISACEELLGMP